MAMEKKIVFSAGGIQSLSSLQSAKTDGNTRVRRAEGADGVGVEESQYVGRCLVDLSVLSCQPSKCLCIEYLHWFVCKAYVLA